MAIYKYGTFSTGTTTQYQLNLGFIPSVFRLRNETIFASGTVTGVLEGYWNQALGALSTPYSMLATYTTGTATWSRTASGSVTTATGFVPYSTPDSKLYVPNQAPYTDATNARQYVGPSTLQVLSKVGPGISQAANALVTTTVAHSFTTAADVGVTVVTFHGVPGMTQINGLSGVITSVPSTTTFTVNINTTNFSAYNATGVTDGISSGFFNVITGAPANTLYSNVSLPTAEANLGSTGLIVGTTFTNGGGATTDVWSYEAILQSPVTGP